MADYRYIPIEDNGVKSYVFRIELIEEDDGRWSVGVPALPGCATWGDSKAEALRNIHDAAEAYLRDMQAAGEDVPTGVADQVSDEPVVAVTV